jgi:galactose mutarotase-like enzyme
MILENESLKIECRPEWGGKITSLYLKKKEFELAARPQKMPEEKPRAERGFSPYAFGMDDAFPNIDAEQFSWKDRILAYPDHGEIWRSEFEVKEQTRESVRLDFKSGIFGYRYEKALRLLGSRLLLDYRITNEGAKELPCIWTWHGLMRYEENMRLRLPKEISCWQNVLEGSILGETGKLYPASSSAYDFSRVPKADTKSMVKYYAAQPLCEGRMGVLYPDQGVEVTLEYDAKALPYLGVWITAGGFQGDYNLALEPTNGFYDSVSRAAKNGKLPVLAQGEQMIFSLEILLEESGEQKN